MSHTKVVPVSYFYSCPPLKGFKAYKTERGNTAAVSYHRSDFYKLSLITAKSRIYYQEEEREIDGSVLFFASPKAAYSWKELSQARNGYNCLLGKIF